MQSSHIKESGRMIILKSLYKQIEEYVGYYNRYCIETDMPMTVKDFFDEAFEFILEYKNKLDYNHMEPLKFLYKSNIEVDYKLKKEHQVYINDDLKAIGNNTISLDDICNFILKSYLLGVFKMKIKKKVIRKIIYDDPRNILFIIMDLKVINMPKKISSDKIVFQQCPHCGYGGFFMFKQSLTFMCYRESCIYYGGERDLIDLIDENPSTSINKAYNILKQKRNNMNEFKKIIRVWEIEVALKMEEEISKQSRNKNLKNLNKSLSRDNTDYFYLKEEGFHDTDFLARNDVAFKDDKKHEISEINKFINRICYIIRNIEGDIVGIQGRSVLSNITKKEKVMNTWDSKSGTHFYLLHQFVNNKKINKVIITEGPKDALRIKESVEKNNLYNIAIISSLGCFMSQAQFYLLSKVFNKKVEICLAFDVDDNGKKGTIHAAKRLKERGFENITFVFPPCFRDDWGELTTRKEQDQIVDSIKNTIKVTMENYENEEDKRGEQRNKEILDRIRQDIRKAFLVNIHRNK